MARLLNDLTTRWPREPSAGRRNLAWELMNLLNNHHERSLIMWAEGVARLLENEKMEKLKVKLLHPDAKSPTRAHDGDLGYDLYALEGVALTRNKVTKVRTGVAVELPGFGFKVCDRSSMSVKGVVSVGGVIDAGYRGEVHVNLLFVDPNLVHYHIYPGDKIAQLVPHEVTDAEVKVVEELSDTARGDRGYGSSGR